MKTIFRFFICIFLLVAIISCGKNVRITTPKEDAMRIAKEYEEATKSEDPEKFDELKQEVEEMVGLYIQRSGQAGEVIEFTGLLEQEFIKMNNYKHQ